MLIFLLYYYLRDFPEYVTPVVNFVVLFNLGYSLFFNYSNYILAFCVGKFLAEFCPSTSGCRMPVSFKDNGNGISREIVEDFVVSFDSSSTHPVWLVIYNL